MTLNRPRSKSQDFRMKYLEYGARYDAGHNGGQRGNHQWAFEWHYYRWPWMTLNPHSSRSLELHVKYFENGDRYDDGVNGSRIANDLWAIDWHHDLWPWMTLNRTSSRSLQLYSNISLTVYGIQRTTLGRYTFHRTYFLFIVSFFYSASALFAIRTRCSVRLSGASCPAPTRFAAE